MANPITNAGRRLVTWANSQGRPVAAATIRKAVLDIEAEEAADQARTRKALDDARYYIHNSSSDHPMGLLRGVVLHEIDIALGEHK